MLRVQKINNELFIVTSLPYCFILSFQKNYNFIATLSGQKSVVKYLSAKNNTYLINYCRIYFTQIVFQNNCSQKNKTVI